MKDKIFCKTCNKEIDLFEQTTVKKNINWDLYCTECFSWLAGMKSLLGWEISEERDIEHKENKNTTMEK